MLAVSFQLLDMQQTRILKKRRVNVRETKAWKS